MPLQAWLSAKAGNRNLLLCYIAIFSLTILTTTSVFSAEAAEESPSFSIWDAKEKGVFNIGPGQGKLSRSTDETLHKDVFKFDYSIPSGSIIGVWTKGYPSNLNGDKADAIRISVNVPETTQAEQISVKVELKGRLDMQVITLSLKPGWNSVREVINWNTIGGLKEVVFVVNPIAVDEAKAKPVWFNPMEASQKGNIKPTTSTLYFDLEFSRVTFFERHFTLIKLGLLIVVSFILALISAFLGGLFGLYRVKTTGDKVKSLESSGVSGLARLKRDFLYGIVAVLILGTALGIYYIGMTGCTLETCFSFGFLVAGLTGVVIAGLLKYGLIRENLTPFEIFQNILLVGLLAVSSSRQELLQAPSTWNQLFMLNSLIAVLIFLIYQIANARSLISEARHLKTIPSILIVITPYLFNWLLLLENPNLLQVIGNLVSAGALEYQTKILEVIGRLFVVFCLNEVVTNGISLATRGKTLGSFKAHLFIFLVSLGVVVSPLIADLGSSQAVALMSMKIRFIVAILTAMISLAGLWGQTYLITGMILDGIQRKTPNQKTILNNITRGATKGMIYTGVFMAILYALYMILNVSVSQKIIAALPIFTAVICGALIFPLLKTIIESFDGSQPFFERVQYSYRDLTLYARGAISGFGFAYMITHGLIQKPMVERIALGLVIGLVASVAVSLLRDMIYALQGKGRIQSWKLYFIDGLLGVFVGSAMAFYLDALQVPVIIEKFKLYTSAGLSQTEYITYPLLNKWGRINLGTYTGGVKLLFIECTAGVINWSIAAWLFAINRVFMQAFFQKDQSPIKFFFSKAGLLDLISHMIHVLRWGLWMSPIIFTFLRMMPNPTWYNQDGAIRSLFAIWNNVTMSPEAFQQWSLKIFVYILAFDLFRIFIWMDHMGLRVATLVNLSFIGLDRLDERIARFIGPQAAQRYIPEAVKRFATWAPLLIPFYIPRGEAWDYAWNTAESIRNASGGNAILSTLGSISFPRLLGLIGPGIVFVALISFGIRLLHDRARRHREKRYKLENREYRVVLKETGTIYSGLIHKECDISRRSYDTIDPCGRILYLVDTSRGHSGNRRPWWPVVGNFPREDFEASRIEKGNGSLKLINITQGIRATIDIVLPDEDTPVELWTISLENLSGEARQLKIISYLEWVLTGGIYDRFHTQYARLYPVMEYASEVNAILSWNKSTKSMGILAADIAPEGFLISRLDFIGRGRSIWSARILETLDFLNAKDTVSIPTFDPIGSLLLSLSLEPNGSKKISLMIGYAKNKEMAFNLIKHHLRPAVSQGSPSLSPKERPFLIGHGEIPPGTPQPYFKYIDNGNKLLISTPYTPRPFDHSMSNALGYTVMVTNRGLHSSANGNSQQNRITPDWPDIVTKEIPSEAIYLYEPDTNEWYSPTHHPLNDYSAKNECEFGVDGTAVFHMTKGTLSSELTVFVPPDEPLGVYLLTIKNNADYLRRIRIAPYFEMVLGFQPEQSGWLAFCYDKTLDALFFENPRNTFRQGLAFASMSISSECVETKRGRFFGTDRGTTHPFLVEKAKADITQVTDERQIASFLGTLEVPGCGEAAVSIILGQSDTKRQAARLIQRYKNIETAKQQLSATRKWWLSLMDTVKVKTNNTDFDQLQNWLKYQALAERVWARRGFYQSSGAFGFRDQLQDTINLIWVEPKFARRQIILHASHQFIEGDVLHWFFTLADGRTAFASRSHASDNLLWLVWAVVEYIKYTGDYSILDEMTSYVVSEFPFAPLPKNKHGWGHLYQRSTRADSIYRHCLKSIDLVLKKRIGRNGLPLMGTGDWNDGLDEIGSNGRGESVWLGFFLYYILKDMVNIIEKKEGNHRKEYYIIKMRELESALERTWRTDRYLRAIHDDGTEIGVKGSGIWEIDALTAAWAVMTGINFERGVIVFNTALGILEKENIILLGWPALREDIKPYLGRSSKYPEGVRENGMYCHGVQWLIKAARILAEQFEKREDYAKADEYRATAYRLWLKISPIPHTTQKEIELYGGQPNKQAADLLTTFDCGRMIWNGYTGASGWMLRQALEGVIGASLINNELILPLDIDKPRGELKVSYVQRDTGKFKAISAHIDTSKNAKEKKITTDKEVEQYALK